MTGSLLSSDELLDLLARHCSGELSDAQAQRLAEALRDNAAARRTYVKYMDLHHALAWEASGAADLDELWTPGGCAPRPPKPAQGRADDSKAMMQRAARFFLGTRLRVALSVASCFIVVLLAVLSWMPASLYSTSDDNPRRLVADRIVAARITGSVDCVWQDAALPLGFGTALYKGQQIDLREGTAEITFENGAVITLRGPAVCVIDSKSQISLKQGALAANVPHGAIGFAVQTPRALLVDLGTEFGVSAPPADADPQSPEEREEEVHVFKGTVELSLRDANLPPRRLTSRQAVRVTADGRIVKLAAAQRDRFPEPIAGEGDTTKAQPLSPEHYPPVTNGLTLWLAADGAVRRNSENRVQVWEDMLAGENTKAQNASQHVAQQRPLWVAEAIADKPAVRFAGGQFLALATPSNLELLNEDYEIFVVARSASPAIQFLIAGGMEEFEIHLNGDAGARFIPAGFNGRPDASDLQPTGHFSDRRAHIFAARVSADGSHRGVISVDGRETADVVERDCRSADNNSLRLGMRSDGTYALRGEIAEVLIYRRQLTARERSAVGAYLEAKYSLTTEY